jgi:dsDNA-binding SOS-regulon protein
LLQKSEECEALKKETEKKSALAAVLAQEKQQLAAALKTAKERLQSSRQSHSGATSNQMLQADASKVG